MAACIIYGTDCFKEMLLKMRGFLQLRLFSRGGKHMVIIQNGILPVKDTAKGEELKEEPGKQTAPPPSEFLSLFGSHGWRDCQHSRNYV